MTKTELLSALEHAHHPTLAAVLVHLTGETTFLTERYLASYEPILGDPNGGLSEEAKAELRNAVADAMVRYWETGDLPPRPDEATLKRIMDHIATENIPDEYDAFVTHELALDGPEHLMPGTGIDLAPEAAAGFKTVIVGAGMSGLLMGIVLKRAGVPFEIIEKNPDVGGTWFLNTYPGCRVDNPNALYSYSFEAQHKWPNHFSPQPVLLEYFRNIAQKYGLRPHIRFSTEVLGASYQEDTQSWSVRVKDADGAETTIDARAFVSAVGQLNTPKYPDIEGLNRFEGSAFHSARWDHSVDLKGKRIGVIGTGCSALQFIPEVAKEASSVTVFQRTPGWLAPTPEYHDAITPEQHALLDHVPFYQVWFRFFLFLSMADGPLQYLVKDPSYDRQDYAPNAEAAELRAQIEQYYAEQAGARTDLADAVTPKFHVSGKRSIRDNGIWLETLKKDHVSLVTKGVSEITPKGVRLEDGEEHAFDVLIYGTGFKASDFLIPMQVTGRGGANLHDIWDGEARAYLGVSVPDFPNFFMMYGPNTNIVVNGSIIFLSECEAHYILGLMKMVADRGGGAIAPKKDVFDTYNREVDAANREMPWGYADANTWYRSASGRVSQNWPFRLIDFWTRTRSPEPGDYIFEANDTRGKTALVSSG
ncbi:MAG: NAD(P)/FAD-dependent oxidoreductase [Pseudomonadota bacterium]